GAALALAVSVERAYVVDGAALRVVDITLPAAPRLLGSVSISGAVDVGVVDNLAVVAAKYAGLEVIDVSEPAGARIVGSTSTGGVSSYATAVIVREHHAYVVDHGGLRVVDFHEPNNPVVIGSTSSTLGLALSAVALDNGLALAPDNQTANSV